MNRLPMNGMLCTEISKYLENDSPIQRISKAAGIGTCIYGVIYVGLLYVYNNKWVKWSLLALASLDLIYMVYCNMYDYVYSKDIKPSSSPGPLDEEESSVDNDYPDPGVTLQRDDSQQNDSQPNPPTNNLAKPVVDEGGEISSEHDSDLDLDSINDLVDDTDGEPSEIIDTDSVKVREID